MGVIIHTRKYEHRGPTSCLPYGSSATCTDISSMIIRCRIFLLDTLHACRRRLRGYCRVRVAEETLPVCTEIPISADVFPCHVQQAIHFPVSKSPMSVIITAFMVLAHPLQIIPSLKSDSLDTRSMRSCCRHTICKAWEIASALPDMDHYFGSQRVCRQGCSWHCR